MGLVAAMMGLNILKILRFVKEEFLIVLGTSSSEAAMPTLMEKLELLGCGQSLVGLTVPLGYAFNLDGSSIYFTMAIVFIAQALNIPLSRAASPIGAMTHSSFVLQVSTWSSRRSSIGTRHTSLTPLRIYEIVDSPCPKRCSRIPRHLPGSTSASLAISCGIRPPLPPVGAGNSISDAQEPPHDAGCPNVHPPRCLSDNRRYVLYEARPREVARCGRASR